MGIEYWDQSFGNTPAVAFSNIPPAAGNGGKVLRVSGAGIGRDIWLESNGTIWRPLNGSAVLYARNLNPITIQNLTEQTAETLGPFPGGLVRAGMRVEINTDFDAGGLGTGSRVIRHYIGAAGGSTQLIGYFWNSFSATEAHGEMKSFTEALADTNSKHRAGPSNASGGGLALANGYFIRGGGGFVRLFPTVDFSQPWELRVSMQSAAETAVTITGATWVGGVATFTTSAEHTLAVGDKTTVALVTPTDWNDTYIVTAVPDSTHFSVAKPVEPAAYTSGGNSSRISNMILNAVTVTLRG